MPDVKKKQSTTSEFWREIQMAFPFFKYMETGASGQTLVIAVWAVSKESGPGQDHVIIQLQTTEANHAGAEIRKQSLVTQISNVQV